MNSVEPKQAWRRLARDRRKAVLLVEELGVRAQRVESMIKVSRSAATIERMHLVGEFRNLLVTTQEARSIRR